MSMIVTDDMVEAALDYLSLFPHPVAKANRSLANAENDAEYIYSQVYQEINEGTVRDRECACNLDTRVRDSKENVAKSRYALDAHKARVRSSEMIIEIWRSENANARAAERIR
jgi:hypothetical protein